MLSINHSLCRVHVFRSHQNRAGKPLLYLIQEERKHWFLVSSLLSPGVTRLAKSLLIVISKAMFTGKGEKIIKTSVCMFIPESTHTGEKSTYSP